MTKLLNLYLFYGSKDLFIDEIDYRFNEDISEEHRNGIFFAVICFNCNAKSSEKDTKNKAISARNSRN